MHSANDGAGRLQLGPDWAAYCGQCLRMAPIAQRRRAAGVGDPERHAAMQRRRTAAMLHAVAQESVPLHGQYRIATTDVDGIVANVQVHKARSGRLCVGR